MFGNADALRVQLGNTTDWVLHRLEWSHSYTRLLYKTFYMNLLDRHNQFGEISNAILVSKHTQMRIVDQIKVELVFRVRIVPFQAAHQTFDVHE